MQIGQALDLVDFETGARVAGQKFYYLKNEAVLLELALVRYALDAARRRGFVLTATPDIAKVEIVEGIGFNPRGEESNIYTIEGTGTPDKLEALLELLRDFGIVELSRTGRIALGRGDRGIKERSARLRSVAGAEQEYTGGGV